MIDQGVLVYLASHPSVIEGRINDAARIVTERVGAVLDLARASVWLFEDHGQTLRCVDLYETGLGRHSCDDVITAAQYPTYFSALTTLRAIAAEDARSDDRTRELARDYLIPLGIGAMLDAGIRRCGAIVGVLCVEHLGGPRRWREAEIAFVSSAADQIALALGNAELLQSEKSLLSSEQRLRAVLDNVPDIFALADGDGAISFINRPFGDQTREALIGTDVVSWQAPAVQSAFREALLQAVSGRTGLSVEGPGWGSSNRWYVTRFLPVAESSGGRVQLLAEEITGAKRIERVLLATAHDTFGLSGPAFLRAVMRRVATTTDADIAFCGELIQDGERVRTHVFWRDGQFGENFEYDLADSPCEVIVRKGPCSFTHDLQLLFPKDAMLTEVNAHAYVGMPLWEADRPIGLLSVMFTRPIRDPHLIQATLALFTNQVSATIARMHAESDRLAATEAADRVKDQFLRTLSHELRTPVTSVRLTARFLLELVKRQRKMTPQTADSFERGLRSILRNTDLEARHLNDVLDVRAILENRFLFEWGRVDLEAIIKKEMERQLEEINNKRLRVSTMCTGPLTFRGDSKRIGDAIRRILENAIKFSSPHGRIDITAHRHGGDARIVIKDEGAGVSADFLPHVFDAFRQQDGGVGRAHSGLGVGLTIARAIVEGHGGTITVASNGENQGTTVTCSFPLTD
jgi:signal transduction histidine kinase/PAS domain-containing protein